jgi:predicted transcriptional regulator
MMQMWVMVQVYGQGVRHLNLFVAQAPASQSTQNNTNLVFHEFRVTIQAMKNVTITMEDEVAEWVRITAAKRNISVSRYVGEVMMEMMRREDAYEQAMRAALKFEPWGQSDGTYLSRDALYNRPATAPARSAKPKKS